MTKPDWFILIEQWRPKGMGQYGVTLPFIVGALAYKAGKTALSAQHVQDVLNDIIQHPVEDYVTEVSWCPNISAPVLKTTQIDSPGRMRSPVAILRPSGHGESLVFGTNLEIQWDTKDPLVWLNRLAEDATDPVSKGMYSRNRKEDSIEYEYSNFRPKELDYIHGTIMSIQEIDADQRLSGR